MTGALAERLAGLATAVATAIVIVAIAILPFLTPAWVAFEQGRTGAAELTGYTTSELRGATDAILADLLFGPPDFDAEVRGEAVLAERERSHMRDVRGVFAGFGVLALASAAVVGVAYVAARSGGHPERAWRAIRAGAIGLAVGVIVAGIVAFFAFDAAFEVFHRLFFAGGSYTFDPGTDRLVQLFPFAFWFETTLAVGAVIIALSLAVAAVAARRVRRHDRAATATTGLAQPEAAR